MRFRLLLLIIGIVGVLSAGVVCVFSGKEQRSYEHTLSPSEIHLKSGFSYTAKLGFDLDPSLLPADSPEGARSQLRLVENGVELAKSHSSHGEIAAKGEGRFSHWTGNTLYFSASDNSDPRSNGRRYTVKAALSADPFVVQLLSLARFSLVISVLFLAISGCFLVAPCKGGLRVVMSCMIAVGGGGGLFFMYTSLFPFSWTVPVTTSAVYHVDGFAYGYDFPPICVGVQVSGNPAPVLLDDSKSVFSIAEDLTSIVERGHGRYLATKLSMVFSTSDGLDPRKNGTEIRVRLALAPSIYWNLIVAFCLMTVAFGYYTARRD